MGIRITSLELLAVFLAVAPAHANTFMFQNATTFDPPNYDMAQGYTPAGTGTSCGSAPA